MIYNDSFFSEIPHVLHHRGRELAYASPPAQIPACALTHGAPASDDDEAQLARLRVLKPIAVTRETPTQSRLRKCVLHRLVGSAEWSFPPAVGFSRRHERLGIPAGPAALDARHTPPGSSALLSYPVNLMWHAFPPLSAARVLAFRILLGCGPWLHLLRKALPPVVRRFHSYYGHI